MSKMVERVARALVAGNHLGVSLGFTDAAPTDAGSIPLLRKRDTERALAAARAAIEAMREPTKAMIDAAVALERELNATPIAAWATVDEDYMGMKWQAMIDKALE